MTGCVFRSHGWLTRAVQSASATSWRTMAARPLTRERTDDYLVRNRSAGCPVTSARPPGRQRGSPRRIWPRPGSAGGGHTHPATAPGGVRSRPDQQELRAARLGSAGLAWAPPVAQDGMTVPAAIPPGRSCPLARWPGGGGMPEGKPSFNQLYTGSGLPSMGDMKMRSASSRRDEAHVACAFIQPWLGSHARASG